MGNGSRPSAQEAPTIIGSVKEITSAEISTKARFHCKVGSSDP